MKNMLKHSRRYTQEIKIGNQIIGGKNPIAIQSMTNTQLKDIDSTLKQIISLYEADCNIIRFAVPSKGEVKYLKKISSKLRSNKINVSLIADIHFSPSIACEVVPYVDKVRINPGNYGTLTKESDDNLDDFYKKEYDNVINELKTLTSLLKDSGKSMRIGINHGSLSKRMMHRYGNTIEGMVYSALEFIEICESLSYKDLIVSLKSSNVNIMISSYRLLVKLMAERDMFYPFHLGITEAGLGLNGIVKSSSGIGTLLEEGIGDTIRVSLTGNPLDEIPIAKLLVERYNNLLDNTAFIKARPEKIKPFSINTQPLHEIFINKLGIGSLHPIRVEIPVNIKELGKVFFESKKLPIEILQISWNELNQNPEMLEFLAEKKSKYNIALSLRIEDEKLLFKKEFLIFDKLNFSFKNYSNEKIKSFITENIVNLLTFFDEKNGTIQIELPADTSKEELESLVEFVGKNEFYHLIFSFSGKHKEILEAYRYISELMNEKDIFLRISIIEDITGTNVIERIINSTIITSGLLFDGIGDIIEIRGDISYLDRLNFGYTILQSIGKRYFQPEYISCPTCGRTKFDVKSTLERIKNKTSHLKGIKIAVMGCIVNGPGEMADAKIGYIGAGRGLVNLYLDGKCIEKNIPEDKADQKLLDIIDKIDFE